MAGKTSSIREQTLAREHLRHIVISSVVTALTTIVVTLVTSDYFNKKDSGGDSKSEQTTIVHTDPANVPLWTDIKDYFIWFNAQYKNASTVHDKNHFDSMKGKVKYSLILIQPNRNYISDFQNFMGKFEDMRKYLKKAKKFGDAEGYDISRAFPEIYIFNEEKIPSISFFLTKNKKDEEKAILYLEEKGYFMDENRRPIVCLETKDACLIKKFESRYKAIMMTAQPHNELSFNRLVSNEPDSVFYLK